MFNPIIRKFQYGQHTVTLETNMIARQATATVLVNVDDTVVLVTVVGDKQQKLGQNFFPLIVNYQERAYATGRFPGSFFRREGRPSEGEILISRLIDRPIRPLFPEGFLNEVQIVATVISINQQVNPDIVAIIGVSAVLSLSGIPFNGPIGAARIGYINNQYILNPTTDELATSKLDLIVVGTANSVLMVESESEMLSEDQILNAVIFGHKQQQIVIKNINELVIEAGKPKWHWQTKETNVNLQIYLSEKFGSRLNDIYTINKKIERYSKINLIKTEISNLLITQDKNINEYEIENAFFNLEKQIVRNHILYEETRIDGRKKDIVRNLDIRTSILPRTHGSALFTRGETQALVVVTLGTERDAQSINKLNGERTDRFLLHYNFPSYCVGEIGLIGSPRRREIGHGALAKRSMLPVIPKIKDFPYTIRVVSEITESNGSSSMASVCGASLALMDAGVPIKEPIAGVAMGLIKQDTNFIILSDILGDEDRFGDMDFKVAGSRTGITVLQIDMKIQDITYEIIQTALYQAKNARMHILNVMNISINSPRSNISKFAPRIHNIKINPDKIKFVIGKNGTVIRLLTEETDTIIEIQDDGIIKITASNEEKINHAIKRIEEITAEIKVGHIYLGKITRIVDFGAFVTIGINKEGLVHISQITTKKHVEKVTDYLKIGQEIPVKVLEIDRNGRIRLSIKEATNESITKL